MVSSVVMVYPVEPDLSTALSTRGVNVTVHHIIVEEVALGNDMLTRNRGRHGEAVAAEIQIARAIKRMGMVGIFEDSPGSEPHTGGEVVERLVGGDSNGHVGVRISFAGIPVDVSLERVTGTGVVFAAFLVLVVTVGTVLDAITGKQGGHAHVVTSARELAIFAMALLMGVYHGDNVEAVINVLGIIETVLDGMEPSLEPLQAEGTVVYALTDVAPMAPMMIIVVLLG